MVERRQVQSVEVGDVTWDKERGDLPARSIHTFMAIQEAAEHQCATRRALAMTYNFFIGGEIRNR
jgi:hypothetical protein